MARYVPIDNIKELRRMLNTEVNTATFNPDVRDHTPVNVIIIIENDDGHIHCIMPYEDACKRMFGKVVETNKKVFEEISKEEKGTNQTS